LDELKAEFNEYLRSECKDSGIKVVLSRGLQRKFFIVNGDTAVADGCDGRDAPSSVDCIFFYEDGDKGRRWIILVELWRRRVFKKQKAASRVRSGEMERIKAKFQDTLRYLREKKAVARKWSNRIVCVLALSFSVLKLQEKRLIQEHLRFTVENDEGGQEHHGVYVICPKQDRCLLESLPL